MKKKKRKRKRKEKEKEESSEVLILGHWNARGLRTKAPVLKQKLAEMGVQVCGVVESHTYRDTYLSDGQWAWDPEQAQVDAAAPARRHRRDGEPQGQVQHCGHEQVQRLGAN